MAAHGSMAGIAALSAIVPPSEDECVRRHRTHETLVLIVDGWCGLAASSPVRIVRRTV